MMELSTGLYVDAELTPGDWKGEEYVAIARNLRSDHLAILPDKIGACSVADGAGLLRNEVRKGKMPKNEILKRIMNVFGLTDNEMSHENIRAAIQTALRAKLNPITRRGRGSGWRRSMTTSSSTTTGRASYFGSVTRPQTRKSH
jgi:hypothetical protein